MIEHNLQHTISLLTRTPAALNALLRDLPETWTLQNEGENTWSAFEIVGHLIHCEHADWMPRVKLLLEFGETKAFEPFDRRGHEQAVQGKSLGQLLDEFAHLRSEKLNELRALNLQPQDLDRRGRHPAFGPVTLSALLPGAYTSASCDAPPTAPLNQLTHIVGARYNLPRTSRDRARPSVPICSGSKSTPYVLGGCGGAALFGSKGPGSLRFLFRADPFLPTDGKAMNNQHGRSTSSTISNNERASYNGSTGASQASDVGSIPIARSIKPVDAVGLTGFHSPN